MEENEHRELFCEQCLLQFGKKYVFDLHLSLVHGKKIEIKTEANSNFNESQVDEDISKDPGGKNPYLCEICNYSSSGEYNLELHLDLVHGKTHIASVHEKNKLFNEGFAVVLIK